MKKLLTLIAFFMLCLMSRAQIALQTADLTGKYKYSTTTVNGFSIHDPSVVWDPISKYFYVYGSHYVGAQTKDFKTWTGIYNYYQGGYNSSSAYKAFQSCPVHKVKRCLPGSTDVEEVTLSSFDAGKFCSIYADNVAGWVQGDQWAPDIVYNPNTKKWLYYLSLNGDNWASVVVLLTSDSPKGPFKYEGPIVFGGFDGQVRNGKSVDYKNTDLEVVLGPQSTLPTRYKTNQWGTYYPNCIDPCVFFDEEGELWMAYGSWSGGIFMLKLDKNTGLRDYTYTYGGTGNTPNATSDDAYFGHRIAGGYYVSGEGSYIQHIGNYYYLFMSYGFFSPSGGYEMRIFRSTSPTGPYVDANNSNAINTSYQMNYGPRAATNKGMKLTGSYKNWGLQTLGECAHGHNSACTDDNGRSFVLFHTKFLDDAERKNAAHAMRAHQLFINKSGWLCAAPFHFNGETWNDDSIATKQPWSAKDIAGDYHFLMHPYKLDYENYAASTPKTIHLSEDGKITGSYTGTWEYTDEGKSYIRIKIGGTVYDGVMSEQTIQGTSASYKNTVSTAKALCFSAICCTAGNTSCGVPIWGYKMQPQYAIAYNYQNNSDRFRVTNFTSVTKNLSLMFETNENVELTWNSTAPEIVSNTGKYNPIAEDVPLKLTARLEAGNYYWEKEYSSVAKQMGELTGDATSGIVAYYNFDQKPSYNLYDDTQKAILSRSSTTTGVVPTFETDWDRFGKVLHQYFAAQGSNSYARIPNPLLGKDIDAFTVSLWVNRTDNNLFDALWSFFGSLSSAAQGPRLFFTGNTYLGFNDNEGSWFDVNHPDTKKPDLIKISDWHLVTVTISKENGYALYVDGLSKYKTSSTLNSSFAGSVGKDAFDFGKVVDFVKSAQYFYLGLGSFWGSADAYFDDLLIYDRELTADDAKALSTMLNRVNDFSPEGVTPLENVKTNMPERTKQEGIYDLYGRKVVSPGRGIYIVNGKKVMFK